VANAPPPPPSRPGSKTTFFTTVRLPPGNHPLRFIVDDQPKCTDTLPTATDTDGTLINYIEIPSPTNSPARSRTNTGERTGSNIGLSDTQPGGKWFAEMEWTGQIPPRLFKLAGEEEAYLAARAAQNPSNGSAPRMHPSKQPPLPPPPPVPYPPSLPRHLEKVILNNPTRNPPNPAILSASSSARPRIMGDRSGAVFGDRGMLNGRGPIANGGTEGTGDDNSVLPVPNHVVLNHLGTSAIKNGVLAVGTTTRYHRKVSLGLDSLAIFRYLFLFTLVHFDDILQARHALLIVASHSSRLIYLSLSRHDPVDVHCFVLYHQLSFLSLYQLLPNGPLPTRVRERPVSLGLPAIHQSPR